jgi:predicted nucleotidyltransferase
VRRLEVFGSASRGDFDPSRSDLDLLVEYLPEARRGAWAGDYFGLKFDLQKLLSRDVDLVMTEAVQNPYFLENIAKDRAVLYEA